MFSGMGNFQQYYSVTWALDYGNAVIADGKGREMISN